ncbi:ACP phosphodiesterase [Rheinheimera sp. 1928-s]|uniref:acyl carrier protein phosphodiesterase n=1 Tax=Rheinheimera sp. 1928-s TaxID=3033803 RepID=UPI002613A48B|nr:ACP phosphodiesterase [Rheinheimera sp. 1928-s]MDF3126732.1 ACP phosphodiesterase [Rheinheimera sp. 1928-s]
MQKSRGVMNYLAHLLLAQPNTDSRIGNLLGDFYHGTRLELLSPAVAAGLYNHRAVDWFTDQHPQVRAARLLFSSEVRRFSPIALDMLFDFCLIKHWKHFFASDFNSYKAQLYRQLQNDLPQMPDAMARTFKAVTEQDWFGRYAQLEGIQQALRRMALHGRFTARYASIADELPELQAETEAVFLEFFPQLQNFIQHAAIEQQPLIAFERYSKATGKDQSNTA